MKAVRVLNVALAVGITAIVALRSHPDELWAAARDIDVKMALLAVVLNLPVALLAPLRSGLVFRALGHDVAARVLIPTTVVGFVAGGLTPAAAGEVLRAGPLRTQAGVPVQDSLVTVLYERALSVYLLAISTAVLFAFSALPAGWAVLALGGGVVLCFLPWPAALALRALAPAGMPVGGPKMLRTAIQRLSGPAERLTILLAHPLLLARWSAVTLSMFALIALQYWILARGVVGDAVTFDDAWMAFGVSTLAAVASLVPLGLGVLDGSLAAVLDRLGATLEQGGIVALLVRATVTLPLVLAALACYLYLNRPWAVAQEAGEG